jgi:translation initiation factor eIF-2B subunit beta
MEYLLEHIRKIESTKDIQELKRKLRRKKDMNSTEASLQIAQLFYDLLKDQTIKNKYKNNPTALILLVQKLGQTFIDIDPVQFCIGNTIKKILHIIREEIRENQKDKNNNSNETKESLSNTVNQENKKLLDIKNLEYTDSDNTTEKSFNSSGQLYEVKKEESNDELNMDVILENIDTLIAEMSSISETITEKKEIKDLISDNDIILTTNYSEQIVKILSENKRTKKFKVFVCESAPKLREKSMSEELKKIKLDVTTVENDDIYSVMKKYTKVKVFLGAKAILNNGGLIAYGGSYNICLLASMFSNPVIIAAGATKLTPMYSFKHEFYNEYLSPDLIFGKNMNYNGDISNIQFNTPSLDYIPPNLISMYATDIGILNPKFLYKNFNEMYDLEDYEI